MQGVLENRGGMGMGYEPQRFRVHSEQSTPELHPRLKLGDRSLNLLDLESAASDPALQDVIRPASRSDAQTTKAVCRRGVVNVEVWGIEPQISRMRSVYP